MMFYGGIIVGVNPTQSYGENTMKTTQDFIDFAIKTDCN